MDELRFSQKRARAYTRKFDWDEARRRVRAGETARAVAESLGVTRAAVYKAVTSPDVTSTAPAYIPPQVRCPTCQGPKTPRAELCMACRHDARLAPPRLVRRPSVRRAALGGVVAGRVVRYRGEYAVVEYEHGDQKNRWLHYWDLPPELVSGSEVVRVLPYIEFES